jgi:ribosomal protein S27AE
MKRILMCAPADSPMEVAGSAYDRECARCGRGVMIAPSGQEYLKANRDAEIVCTPCMLAEATGRAEIALPADSDQIAGEMATARPNMRRYRN